MHALLQWLVGLAMLCNSSLLSAQTFTPEDSLKYTVLAERVNDNTVVVRLAALNETSLFWANQQGILLKRYTIARDGSPLSDAEIESSKVEFPLSPMSSNDMEKKGASNEMWQRLHDVIYSPDFAEAANSNGLDPTKVTRHFFSNFAIAQGFEFGVAQALAFEDNTTVKNEAYVYFASSTMSADEIAAQFNLHGFRDEQVVFKDKWKEVFLEAPLSFENQGISGFYGYSGDNTVEEESFFTLPKPEALYGSVHYLEATVQPSTKLLMKYYKAYKLQRLNNSNFQWEVIANKSVFAKEHKVKEELAQNKVEYSYLLIGENGFYGNWLGTGGPPSDILKLKGDVPTYGAGERPFQIGTKHKNVKGSLKLRWVPLNFETWQLGNKNGYKVERFLIENGPVPLTGAQIDASKVTTILKIKPEAEFYAIDSIVTQSIYHPEDFKVVDYGNPALKAAQAETDDNERMGIALYRADDSLTIAKASALAFEERQLLPDCKYRYVISINNLSPAYQKMILPASVEVNTSNWRTVGDIIEPMVLTGTSGDRTFELRWKLAKDVFHYSGFYIQRKKKGTTQPFVKLNAFPYVYNADDPNRELIYQGSLPENKVPYLFRIIGRTPFGETIVATNELELSGYPAAIEDRPFITDVKEQNKGKLTVKWTFSGAAIGNITGFEVWRAATRDGDFVKTGENIPVNVFEYTDLKPMVSNYYVVVAKDKNLYDLPSVPRLAYPSDEIPPVKPQDVTGTSDDSGNVTLTWTANVEDDLKGYIVYYSNNQNGEYLPISGATPLTSTSFSHAANIQSLTELSNYKVAAIDYRDNLSTFSAACVVKLPDVIPPGNPLIVNIESVAAGVKIRYEPSSSVDVVKHEIQRKADYEAHWETVKEYATIPTDKVFIDADARSFVAYDYRLVAIDDANLKSESTPLHIKNMKDGVRLSISNFYVYRDNVALKALAVPNNNATTDFCYMKVYWEYPEFAGIYDFQIYRSYKNSPFILVKSVTYKDALFAGTLNVTENASGGNVESPTSTKKMLGKPAESNPIQAPIPTVEGKNPPLAIKPIRAFLACDDDLNTTLQAATNPNAFKYEIMVRFLDGTASKFTLPIGIK
jgi:uncharacterized protein